MTTEVAIMKSEAVAPARGCAHFLAAIFLAASLSACHRGPARPQTTAEFRSEIEEGRRGRTDRWVVEDSFEAVSERMNGAFTGCFAQDFTSCETRVGGGGACISEQYSTSAVEEGPDHRAVGLMMTTPGVHGPFRHGAYRTLVDIERRPDGTALLTYHGWSLRMFDSFLRSVQRWSVATETPVRCPEVKGNVGFGALGASEIPQDSSGELVLQVPPQTP